MAWLTWFALAVRHFAVAVGVALTGTDQELAAAMDRMEAHSRQRPDLRP